VKKGQSILEYVMVVTAIVGIIVWAVSKGSNGSKGPVYQAAENTINASAAAINKGAEKIRNIINE